MASWDRKWRHVALTLRLRLVRERALSRGTNALLRLGARSGSTSGSRKHVKVTDASQIADAVARLRAT